MPAGTIVHEYILRGELSGPVALYWLCRIEEGKMIAGSIPHQRRLGSSTLWLRLSRATLFCALALLLALAAPSASMAWMHGGHVTADHMTLHDRQVSEGLHDHHPATGHSSVPVNVCQRAASATVTVPANPVVQAGTVASAVPGDSLQATTAQQAERPAANTTRRLVAAALLGAGQTNPSPSHRPPISS